MKQNLISKGTTKRPMGTILTSSRTQLIWESSHWGGIIAFIIHMHLLQKRVERIHWMVNISWEMLLNSVSYKAIFTSSNTSESNCWKLAVSAEIHFMAFYWNINQSESTKVIQRNLSLFSFQYKTPQEFTFLWNDKNCLTNELKIWTKQ